MEQRNIELPNGKILEVEFKKGFLDKIREAFDLKTDQPVSDDHIRMFFYGSLNTAINKEETFKL
tara:strand:+ start:1677 stop:1868 length:192 start_codon:yes stop_codon:yes gene_type:complete